MRAGIHYAGVCAEYSQVGKAAPTVPCTNRKCRCGLSTRLRLRRRISTARILRRCCLSCYNLLDTRSANNGQNGKKRLLFLYRGRLLFHNFSHLSINHTVFTTVRPHEVDAFHRHGNLFDLDSGHCSCGFADQRDVG